MSFMSGLVDGVDTLLASFSGIIKQNLGDYVDLETADDEKTLVGTDGSLMSMIKVDGVRGLVGSANFESDIRVPLNSTLSSYLDKKDHALQMWFSIDNDRIQDELRNILGNAFETAKNLNLDANDILEERIRNLSRFCAVENCYIILWTKTTALTDSEKKSDLAKIKDKKDRLKLPLAKNPKMGQDVVVGLSSLRDRHNSFSNLVEQDFNQIGISAKRVEVRDALKAIRNSIDPQFTDNTWEPRLPGDKVNPRIIRNYKGKEKWDLQWPRLGWQLCPREAEMVDSNTVIIGDRIYAPIFMDLAPKEIKRFDALFGRLVNQDDIPWRVSFMLSGGGMAAMSWKNIFVSFLKLTSHDNKMIDQGMTELRALQMNQEAIVKLQITFATWANKDQVDLIQKRKQILARAVEGWGGCEVSEITGDPVEGLMSSAVGISQKSIGTVSAAPLLDVIKMLPLNRPSSAWDRGAVLFRSPDGKILPFQPGSSKQTTWISLAFARPGSGKSVLMNVTNFALCLSDKLKRLPRIAIIDIGPSSSGLISLIREALPYDQKHLAAYERLRNTRDYAINPFDTQLGARFPTPAHRSFLMNLITLLVTDPAKDIPPEGMAGLVMDCIDEVYRQRLDGINPRKFSMQIDLEVDEMLKKSRTIIDNRTTWWEVADILFGMGEYRLAGKAQRHAVPTLADLPQVANSEKFRQKYSMTIAGTGEELISGFSRMISNSQDMYPLLAYPTVFDISEARVLALDLDEVARGGGASGDRQTQIMYMLARQAASGDFYLNEADIQGFPAPSNVDLPDTVPTSDYKLYHKKRIQDLREDLKRVCYDEFHRTSSSSVVRNQVILDMREGRKWNVDIMLASQAIQDFDPTMIQFATAIYIMDPGNAENLNLLEEKFGLNPTEKSALANQVHGPRAEGVTFMARFETTNGSYSSLLSLTVGAMEMWALNTTVESVAIRKRLYERIGPKKARKILARVFPSGTAKAYVEERKAVAKQKNGILDEMAESNIYDSIVDELVRNYSKDYAD